MNPYLATLLTFIAALTWLRLMDFFAARGWISSNLSRKIIHIGTGPIFILCWLLFPDQPVSRWLAALVPLVITIQFALVGTGLIQDEEAVQAMTRSGDRREILRGPLYYGIMFVLITVLFWKDAAGVAALLVMCGGDGLADIVGRRIASPRLPWSPRKSVAGSIAVLLGGWLLSALILQIFLMAGTLSLPPHWLGRLFGITLLATLVESLPYRDIDNITITLTVLAAAWFWL